MTTRLNGPLKRELEIEGQLYTLTISPDALKLVPKGHRNGHELQWKSLVSGEAAPAAAPTRNAPEGEPGGGGQEAP